MRSEVVVPGLCICAFLHVPFVTALSCLVVIGLAGPVSDLGSASVSRLALSVRVVNGDSFAARGA